jgi:hypothetical protein
LPPHHSFNYAIDFKNSEQPPWGPIYALSDVELKVVRKYLDKILHIGKIQPSILASKALIPFVPTPHRRGV